MQIICQFILFFTKVMSFYICKYEFSIIDKNYITKLKKTGEKKKTDPLFTFKTL